MLDLCDFKIDSTIYSFIYIFITACCKYAVYDRTLILFRVLKYLSDNNLHAASVKWTWMGFFGQWNIQMKNFLIGFSLSNGAWLTSLTQHVSSMYVTYDIWVIVCVVVFSVAVSLCIFLCVCLQLIWANFSALYKVWSTRVTSNHHVNTDLFFPWNHWSMSD